MRGGKCNWLCRKRFEGQLQLHVIVRPLAAVDTVAVRFLSRSPVVGIMLIGEGHFHHRLVDVLRFSRPSDILLFHQFT